MSTLQVLRISFLVLTLILVILSVMVRSSRTRTQLFVGAVVSISVCIVLSSVHISLDNYVRIKDSKLDQLQQRISKCIPEIKQVDVVRSDKSFTINKKYVHVCAQDDDGQYYEDNMLIFVMLHELAHALCPDNTEDHPPSWQKEFNKLLDRATDCGVYDPKKPLVQNYCGYD